MHLYTVMSTECMAGGLALLPGVPPTLLDNPMLGSLQPGSTIDLSTVDGLTLTIPIISFCVQVPKADLDRVDISSLPIVLIVADNDFSAEAVIGAAVTMPVRRGRSPHLSDTSPR